MNSLLLILSSAMALIHSGPQSDVDSVRARLTLLQARIADYRASSGPLVSEMPSVEWFAKGVAWGLGYEPPTPQDLDVMKRALKRGCERMALLESGRADWNRRGGRVARGYRSEVDGSIQPYGLIVPKAYAPTKSIRLDVVLHGSTRPVGMSELRYVMPFDEGDGPADGPADRDYIELYPLGRVENCYRWAGETDVFEAIEDVCRHYNIDRDRIVLRGMSMGASGTWHLGLKHPDKFVALGPYCGYVDTHRFSETPGMNFVTVGPLPVHQELGLHMLDSVDYAANAAMIPVVAAMGEKDPFFQAHVIMGAAFQKEGLPFTNLISPGTAHVQDPATWTEQMRRVGEFASIGVFRSPKRVRFVTWTLKYNRCQWIELLTLGKHYQRAEIEAQVEDDGSVTVTVASNVERFAIYRGSGQVRIGSSRVPLPDGIDASRGLVLERRGRGWRFAGYRDAWPSTGKRPGVQGPIDDAFTSRFLCVRPTGTPWNPTVDAWAKTELDRFAYEWRRYFRGELPVKKDVDVTEADRRTCNLILFGDPGSNRILREAVGKLPVKWTAREVRMGKLCVSALTHAPAFIGPSPFTADRYVVVNSGHTFHEAELNRLNYLLFPRLGDWAILNVKSSSQAEPAAADVVQAGYFDETWSAK
jgi:poly(3-hydroxybutyrate) depolymerase